jgi:hypothetical protein
VVSQEKLCARACNIDAYSSEPKSGLHFKLCTLTKAPLRHRQQCLTERRRRLIRLFAFSLFCFFGCGLVASHRVRRASLGVAFAQHRNRMDCRSGESFALNWGVESQRIALLTALDAG